MKRKAIFLYSLLAVVAVIALWIGNTGATGRYRVLLIGMDGGSWDIVRRLASENRIPNMQKLIDTGAAGHLDSIAWRKRSGGSVDYFSPIVWSSIATGKLPSKTGVDDFKLPMPNTVNFRMGVPTEDTENDAVLVFPFSTKDTIQLALRARAPEKAQQSSIQVFFNNRPIGSCVLTEKFEEYRFTITPDLMLYQNNKIMFRFTRARHIGKNDIAADVEFIRLYNSTGKEVLDYNHTHDPGYFGRGWIHDVPMQFALASSFHIRTRTLWEILSNMQKRIAVVGWWATWPAYEVNGYLVTSHVGLHGSRTVKNKEQNFLDTLPDLTYPADFLKEIKPLYTPQEEMVPEFGRLFFDIGQCECIGYIQEKIVLERFWQDKFFGRISRYLMDDKGKFDLFAVYFRGTDTMSHQFLGYASDNSIVQQNCAGKEGCDLERIPRIVDNYYTFVDGQIGELLKRTDKKTIVMVITDHGQAAVGRKGSHENNGYIIMSGPGVRQITFTDASTLDITPTILYILNLPVGQDMDGRVLQEAFQEKFVMDNALAYVDSYDRIIRGSGHKVQTNQDLEARDTEELKALGYLN